MKKSIVLVLLGLMAFQSKEFKSLYVKRTGSGSKEFYVSFREGHPEIKVTYYAFKKVEKSFRYEGKDKALVELTRKALEGKVNILDKKTTQMPAGTWASAFLVSKNDSLEITDTGILNQLLEWEKVVDDKMASNR